MTKQPSANSVMSKRQSTSTTADARGDAPQGKSGTRRYHRATPNFWANASMVSQTLYPTVVTLDCPSTMKPCAPMLILTRCPLPVFEPYNSFFKGVPITTRLSNAAHVNLNPDQLRNLALFTLRVCRTIMNKPLISTLDDMLYLFAPMCSCSISAGEIPGMPSILECISWEVVMQTVTAWGISINAETSDTIEQDIQDAVIQDRWAEFTRRYEVVMLRRDMTPHSSIPNDLSESSSRTLLDVVKSKSQSFTDLRNNTQPIIEVSVVEYHTNYLSPTSQTSGLKVAVKYLIPELCNKLIIPASILRTAFVLPSVLHKIDSLLLVKELNATMFNDTLSEGLLSMAVTCPSAGMEFDYERLELLGDAFLKYLSTVHIIASNGARSESAMHDARQRTINNKTLTQSAVHVGLPAFVDSRPFVSKQWMPPYFFVSQSSDSLLVSNQSDLEIAQPKTTDNRLNWLADKTVADVTEAIIGAAYLSGGFRTAFDVTKLLHIPLPMITWSDLQTKVFNLANSGPSTSASTSQANVIKSVETLINCKFERPHLFMYAIVHQNSSISNAVEFAGDAVLDFFVTRYVFNREYNLSSGGLSLLKAAMVSNSTLGAIAVSSTLSDYIFHMPRETMLSIGSFSKNLRARQNEENERGAEEKIVTGQYWRGTEPPKILVHFVKSIIGILCMSDCCSLASVEPFFENVLRPFYDKYITLKTLAQRPTATLVELLRAQGCHSFDIKKEALGPTTRCQVLLHGQILASAECQRPSYAVIRACHSALDSLTNSPFLSSCCDCRAYPSKKAKQSSFDHLLATEDT